MEALAGAGNMLLGGGDEEERPASSDGGERGSQLSGNASAQALGYMKSKVGNAVF